MVTILPARRRPNFATCNASAEPTGFDGPCLGGKVAEITGPNVDVPNAGGVGSRRHLETGF